jgi:pimeloyl-ACP methyl ester carboxylesterase
MALSTRLDQVRELGRRAPAAATIIAQYEADLAHRSLDRLHGIGVPTLATVGTFDVAVRTAGVVVLPVLIIRSPSSRHTKFKDTAIIVQVPPLYAEAVVAAIGDNARLHYFERGGHLHNLEQPAEFNAVTLAFLDQHR